MSGSPSSAFSARPKPRAARRCAPQNNNFAQKTKKEIAPRNRTNDHQTASTDHHGQCDDGFARFIQGSPYFPYLLVFFVVVWHVFSYKFPASDDTTVPWVAAWAPSASGCQHTQPAQNKAQGASWAPLGVTQRKTGALAAQPYFTTLCCGVVRSRE